ncbi:hypothetical protein H1R20_g7411, partial [Candolleomyces eurysporus]
MPLLNDPVPTGIFVGDSTIPRCPSDQWFDSLGWIGMPLPFTSIPLLIAFHVKDGASNPPIYFYTHDEKLTVLRYFRPNHPRIAELEAQPAPPMYRNDGFDVDLMGLGSAPIVNPSPPPPTAVAPPSSAAAAATEDEYRVTVTMRWTMVEDQGPLSRASAKVPAPKKMQENKFAVVNLRVIERDDFILAFLRAHDQHEKYRVGTSGPPFKLWWTGCGAKTNAVTIDNDEEFQSSTTAILQRRGKNTTIVVDFDVDQWVPFRVRKRTLEDDNEGEEITTGTKVPRLADFSEDEILHGRFIVLLKKRWPCETHLGEHGETGYCYVDPAGQHFGLNMRRLKCWAAAIAAGDASAKEPPNSIEFDGPRDGRVSSTRPRGRAGPHRAEAQPPAAPYEPLSALVTVLAAKMVGDMTAAPSTPKRPFGEASPATALSPVPTRSLELHACLEDFREKEGVDLTGCESKLVELRYVPGIISRVPLSRLIEVTGAIEGDAILFQTFCEKWCARLDEKKRSLSSTF